MFVGSRKVERDRYVSIASMTHVSSAVFHIRLRHFEINSPLELKKLWFFKRSCFVFVSAGAQALIQMRKQM